MLRQLRPQPTTLLPRYLKTMEEILALPETGPGETQETWAWATFPGKPWGGRAGRGPPSKTAGVHAGAEGPQSGSVASACAPACPCLCRPVGHPPRTQQDHLLLLLRQS